MIKRIVIYPLVWILATISIFWLVASSYGMPGVKSWKAVWDANQEEDLAGYYLYWRAPGEAFTDANKVEIRAPEHEKDLGFLPAGTWELAVTAFDTSGNESGFSNIVTFRKDTSEPSVPVNVEIRLIISTE